MAVTKKGSYKKNLEEHGPSHCKTSLKLICKCLESADLRRDLARKRQNQRCENGLSFNRPNRYVRFKAQLQTKR